MPLVVSARKVLFACLLALAPAAAQANAGDDMASSACAAAKDTPRPAKDSAGPVPKDCDVDALYYGVGGKPDYRAARACALNSEIEDYGGLGAAAILSMIYANGDGVPRDDTLATAYACEAGGAPAEISGRIGHLAQRQRDQSTDRFDFCDDITSGLMEGACALRTSRIEAGKRDVEYARLTKRLSPPAKRAFAELRKAFAAYRDAVGDNEVDISGTARGAMIVEAREAEETAFMATLEAALSGAARGQGTDLKLADAALNEVYKKAQTSGADVLGTVTTDGIRIAQRAWLPYRDSFVAFARAAGSNMSSDAVAGRLTARRVENLKAFVGGEGEP